MWSEGFIGAFLFTAAIIDQVSCYGFKFGGYGGGGGGGGGNGDSQQSQNQSPTGFFWNGFRAYPQTQPQSAPVQIKFDDDESEEDPEYMYELLFGHQVRDIEKYQRQKGCLCNNRFRDPHCGSDYKLYDNGCYFECAQKRNPGLKLVNWGKC